MNFTSTHDISRAINIFGSKEFCYSAEWAWDPIKASDIEYQKNYHLTEEEYKKGIEIYKTFIFALTFFPGILSIFYGDEVGVQGLGNLSNRKSFPWGKEDTELLEFFRTIGKIRNEEKFLETADTKIIDVNHQNFIFERNSPKEDIFVAVNRSNDRSGIYIPEQYKKADKAYSLFDSKIHEIDLNNQLFIGNNELDSHGALVLKKKRN
jgi:glycosidase